MRPEAAKYPSQVDLLVQFIEGRLEGSDLDAALATEEMKTLLGSFEDSRYPALTNHYRRLHNKQDRTKLEGLVNSEGIIEDFLRKAEVPCQPVERFGSLYSLILQTVPKHLDPPMEFIEKKILPAASNLSEGQMKKAIKERLNEHFRYVDKPPRWIQNPDWPICEDRPLVFVGQLEIDAPEHFHDKGAAYLFFDPTKGDFRTVTQFH
jgi:hypothetical protein